MTMHDVLNGLSPDTTGRRDFEPRAAPRSAGELMYRWYRTWGYSPMDALRLALMDSGVPTTTFDAAAAAYEARWTQLQPIE